MSLGKQPDPVPGAHGKTHRRGKSGSRIAILLMGAGLMLHVLGFLLVPFPPPAFETVETNPARPVQWLWTDHHQPRWLEETLALRDPVSLFYAASRSPVDRVTTPAAANAPIDLRILEVFPRFNPPLDLRETLTPEGWMLQNRSERQLEPTREWNLKLLTASFGQREEWKPENLEPALWTRVHSASSGTLQLEFQLPEDELSPPRSLWEPIHLRIQIAPGDFVPPPLLLRGSGDETFDSSVVRSIIRLPEVRQLPAGFYDLRVFP